MPLSWKYIRRLRICNIGTIAVFTVSKENLQIVGKRFEKTAAKTHCLSSRQNYIFDEILGIRLDASVCRLAEYNLDEFYLFILPFRPLRPPSLDDSC